MHCTLGATHYTKCLGICWAQLLAIARNMSPHLFPDLQGGSKTRPKRRRKSSQGILSKTSVTKSTKENKTTNATQTIPISFTLVSRQVQLDHFTLGGKFNQLSRSVTNLSLNIIQAWEGQLFNLLFQLTLRKNLQNLRIFCFQKTLRLDYLLSSALVWVCAQ